MPSPLKGVKRLWSDLAVRREMAELVEQHYRELYRFAYRLSGRVAEAEDLTQQTFLQAQRNLGQLRHPAGARAWLFAILRNQFLKEARGPQPCCLPELDGIGRCEPGSEPPLPHDIDPERLQQALEELPDEFRTPLVLFYFDESSYREIADQMQIPLGTVMSRLARAKAHLRARLSDDLPANRKPLASRRVRDAL